MQQAQKRQTAHPLWISILHNGQYVKQMGEFEPNYVQYKDMQIGRVNIIGTIIAKYVGNDKTYVAFTIDDGSSAIQIKAWKEDALAIEKYKLGDLILVIGKPKEYSDELYISPEIIQEIKDPNLELIRKLELLKQYGFVRLSEHKDANAATLAQKQPVATIKAPLEEERIGSAAKTVPLPGENKRQKVLTLIEQLCGDDGAPITSLIEHSGMSEDEVMAITQELMKEGEIYQNRPGRLSILG